MTFPYPEKIIPEISNIEKYLNDNVKSDHTFTDLLSKVPNTKEAALLCIHFIAAHHIKKAASDHNSPDPDWIRILAIMWKHWPEFSTNKDGKRYL